MGPIVIPIDFSPGFLIGNADDEATLTIGLPSSGCFIRVRGLLLTTAHRLCFGYVVPWTIRTHCPSSDPTIAASRHRGIAASRHRGIAASRHRGIAASRHRGIAASRHRGIAASRHRGIAASRHRGIAASRHRGIAASRHRGIAASKMLVVRVCVSS
ncbi:hypothetical protein NO932_02360 [Pelagibacterium sp. 26DY04]|uniref:hypothetical protein n=1 Tax=Pelagibacterium sp. 26DY04 TaxID=2967130 RepID=UPI0028158AB6|nr:hypothetical protein [Pelagibacterium sp. 26DY04]WMT87469.1 hypothetical protein NO932_02360 [Pelagibacterium sp. 26DY04]